MADPKQTTSTTEEQQNDTQNSDAYTLKDRHKTFSQLVTEIATKKPDAPEDSTSQTPADKPLSDKPVEESKPTDEELARQKKDEEDRETKKQAEIAAKAAEEVVKKQQQEEQARLDRAKAEEDEKKRQEALRPSWQKDPNAQKDKDGNPLPKSYDELTAETVRIATEKAKEEMRQELAAKEQAQKDTQEKAAAEQSQKEATVKAYNDNLARQMKEDEDDLYAKNLLPKIKNPDDPKDPGKVAYDNLYKKAVEVNAARLKEGKPLISSIKLIYYDYYQPTLKEAKPAGHDAPVMGSESTQSDGLPEDKYVVSRDRKKSWDQLIKEEAKKQATKFRVRN